MKYSVKAIVCCLSKGVLMMGVFGGFIMGIVVLGFWCDKTFDISPPLWLGAAFGAIVISGAVGGILFAICSETIPSCQIAVDTHRKPWYWLPWVGDPLPSREYRECRECGQSRLEEEDEYRERLGLESLQ
jgi:hypothetical protein